MRYGAVNADRDVFTKFMAEIREDIKAIHAGISRVLARFSETISESSPLTLTEKGQRISEKLDATTVTANLAINLKEGLAGKSPYEIQDFCFDYIRQEFEPDDDFSSAMKDCAFYEGTDLEGVRAVLAVELRNHLLTAFGLALE